MELTYLLIKIKNLNRSIYIILIYPTLVRRVCYVGQSVIRKIIINLIFFSQYVKDHIEIFTSKLVSFSNLLQRYNKFLNYKNFGAKNFIFFIFCFSGGPRFEQDRKVMSLTCYQLHQSAIFVPPQGF